MQNCNIGTVFNVQRFSLHDGPGIRTLVFLKGCPLRCRWCANPESQNPLPELAFSQKLCDNCGKCVRACPEQAIVLDANRVLQIESRRCTHCGRCVEVCDKEALAVYGENRTAEDVFREVQRDIRYYGSDGGVTVSGGEPLQQASFVLALFQMCREARVHTALETSGFADTAILSECLKLTDLVLYDLKHLDAREHRKLTGRSNSLILGNARLVVNRGAEVQFRIPLVQGLNTAFDNIKSTAQFLRDLQGDKAHIELMPYHTLGREKYKALGRVYPLEGLKPCEPLYAESVKHTFEELGVRCLVSR